MNERTRQGLHVLEAALLLGVLGDALLRATPWGLNFFLWTGAVLAAAVALLERWRRGTLKGEGVWLLLPLIGFSAAVAWRDSLTLKWLDALAVACAFGLLAWRASGASVKLAGLGAYALGLADAGLNTILGGVPLVCADVRWRELQQKGLARHALAAARGLLIAVPLVLLFGGLFMAADAVFAGLVNRTFRFDTHALFTHGLLLTFLAWLTAGYLRGLLFGASPTNAVLMAVKTTADYLRGLLFGAQAQFFTRSAAAVQTHTAATAAPVAPPASVTAATDEHERSAPKLDQSERGDASNSATTAAPTTAPRFKLGAVEVGVVLGSLDALFLGFVCVQVRYLFGGAAWVAATGGLTYAEYARRGFFELVWVTALALPLLLVLHWLLRADDRTAQRLFRWLAFAQLALLFVVIASALTRMRLYQREYGLTELRLYTTAFMGWLALVCVWFTATVLRGARERFAYGALVAAVLVLGALHVINPDATIVRANVAHARTGRAFDAAYASTLSADAVPTLVGALPNLSPDARRHAAQQLLARWSPSAGADWRVWSVARSDAWRAVAAHEAPLREWAGATPADTQAPVSGTLAPASVVTEVVPANLPPPAQSGPGAAPGGGTRW